MFKIEKNKNTRNHTYSRGFTLVETMVTIFIFTIIMLGTSLMIQKIFVNNRQQTLQIGNIDRARSVANIFINEIRNSTYGVNGAYPLGEASDNQIIFFSTTPLSNGTPSKIRYYVSNGILYKGITNPTGNPLVYNPANEQISTLISKMSLGSNPLFYYYDGTYNGSTNPLVQPVNINNIKFIKINLIVLKEADPTSTSTFTINGGGSLRNLKTNLGN